MRHEPSPQQVAAEALRHELDLGHDYVDVFEVAHRLGLEILQFPAADGTIDGMYEPTEHGGYVLVNSNAPFVRQRFTLAHEIGHHRLHGDRRTIDGTIDSTEDWEANRFAEAFLVDETGARKVVANLPDEVGLRVAHVCHLFYVSPSAAAIALKRYRLIADSAADDFVNTNTASYATLLRAHGLPPRPEPRKQQKTAFDEGFRNRVLTLIRTGQLIPERGAELLEEPTEQFAPFASTAEQRQVGEELIAEERDETW